MQTKKTNNTQAKIPPMADRINKKKKTRESKLRAHNSQKKEVSHTVWTGLQRSVASS
jgi:hypothetical protein